MTVIRPNSISGINSITANGGDINLFRSDGTKADVPIVNNITAGVVTATKFVGPIEATTGTFSGNLGVGGVLTYEDVTNIDSIGIITARAGINVSGGTITGDGSGLTGVGLGTDGSANTSGIITATAFVPTTGQLSHRNIIINGDFRIAQRGSSSTSNGYQTVDRWAHYTGSSGVTATFSQQSTSSSDTPYQNGFSNFFRTALSGAGTANAGAYFELMQTIEAQEIANSGWNFKSSSSYITLSFWVRPSTNQTFYGYLRSYDSAAYVYAFSFTASGNNTWTKITKTIAGNSNLQFDNNNGHGLLLMLTPFFGTDYTNNRTLNTWNAMDSTNYFPDMASTWLTAGASTFDVTGVQLEVGPVATPFEHRSFAEEKKRCERYYQTYGFTTLMGSLAGQVGTPRILFPTEMRATPAVTVEYGSNGNGSFRNQNDGSTLTGHTIFNYYTNGFDCRGNSGSPNIIYSSTYKANAEL
jgi:hypothetical protein